MKDIPHMVAYINKNIEEIPKERFVTYFRWSMIDMLKNLIQFNESEKYGAVDDKVYVPPPLELEDKHPYEYYDGRYIIKDKKHWHEIEKLTQIKPEIQKG